MDIVGLRLVRDRLKGNQPLNDFFYQHYQKDARHFLGNNKKPNANEIPCICYVPVSGSPKFRGAEQQTASIVLWLQESEINCDDEYQGIVRSSEAEKLILAALVPTELDDLYRLDNDAIEAINDMGMQHPYYQTEISIIIMRRK